MPVHHLTADADVFTCNVFLVPGETTTLVDAGSMPGIVAAIERHVDGLDQVLITHQDGDHVAELDAVVDAYPDVVVRAFDDHPLRTDALIDGESLQIGDDTATVHFTPGHGTDHVSFTTDTALFSGDVVVHDDSAFTGGSFGKTDRPDDDREVLIDSIRGLLTHLDGVEHLYPGHGSVFHGEVNGIVERALERAERREPKYPD